MREIVSNAPDALEKIRYEFITDPEKVKEQPNSFIKIVPDKTNSTITIEDNGIGMTENEFACAPTAPAQESEAADGSRSLLEQSVADLMEMGLVSDPQTARSLLTEHGACSNSPWQI